MIVKMPVDRIRYLTAEITARLLEIEELKYRLNLWGEPVIEDQIKDLEDEIKAIEDEIDDLDEAIKKRREIVK